MSPSGDGPTYAKRGEIISRQCYNILKALDRNPLRLSSTKELCVEINLHALYAIQAIFAKVSREITGLTLYCRPTKDAFQIKGNQQIMRAMFYKSFNTLHRLERLSISAFRTDYDLLFDWINACPRLRFLQVDDADQTVVPRYNPQSKKSRKKMNKLLKDAPIRTYSFPPDHFSRSTTIILPNGIVPLAHSEVLLPVVKAGPSVWVIHDLGDFFGKTETSQKYLQDRGSWQDVYDKIKHAAGLRPAPEIDIGTSLQWRLDAIEADDKLRVITMDGATCT